MRRLIGVVLLALQLAAPARALADNDEDCFKATLDETGDRAIAICGRILAEGRVQGRNLARTHNNRGLGYLANQEIDKAMAEFDAAIRADPTYPFAYDNRGDIWRRRGQPDRAIAEYNEAIRQDPSFISAYVNRAITFEQMGNRSSARADYEAALEMTGNGRAIDTWAKEVAERRLKTLGDTN